MGFTVHGLWPQYEQGYPQYCSTDERDPSRRENAAMADIMASPGLAAHQWRKHGRCTGLSAGRYFHLIRAAAGLVAIPESLTRGSGGARLTVDEVKHKVRAANPDMPADGMVVQCQSGMLTELRFCLTRDLEPRSCGIDLHDRCGSGRINMYPPR
ncbi:MAG: ribonuclease T [Paracoccus sp. (in: a-proteobacteria)]|nr:ribonuclease T [Paracoccus sp. (in: a-proteobacteria)]